MVQDQYPKLKLPNCTEQHKQSNFTSCLLSEQSSLSQVAILLRIKLLNPQLQTPKNSAYQHYLNQLQNQSTFHLPHSCRTGLQQKTRCPMKAGPHTAQTNTPPEPTQNHLRTYTCRQVRTLQNLHTIMQATQTQNSTHMACSCPCEVHEPHASRAIC